MKYRVSLDPVKMVIIADEWPAHRFPEKDYSISVPYARNAEEAKDIVAHRTGVSILVLKAEAIQ